MGNFIKQFFDIKFWKFILVGILTRLWVWDFNFCSLTSVVGMNGFHRLSATSSAVF